MKLTYSTGTNYSETNKELTVDLTNAITEIKAFDTIPTGKKINSVLAVALNVKDTNYSKVSQLRESTEFHALCDTDGHPNMLACKKSGRKVGSGNGGPRGNNGLSEKGYSEIGKMVVAHVATAALEIEVDSATTNRTETLEWAKDNTETLLTSIRKDWKPTERPIYEPTEKAKNTALTNQLAASVKALKNAGLEVDAIVDAVDGLTTEMVEAILASE